MARIAIISTMSSYPWGGSEYLWTATAQQALLNGHEVFLSIYDWSVSHQLVAQLHKQGAHLLPRPRFPKPPSLSSRIVQKISKKIPLTNKLSPISFYCPAFDCKPDVICISQGSTYDTIYCPDLLDLLKSSSIPYVIVCQFNLETVVLNNLDRSNAQELFNKAALVAFVSYHNLKLAERQLAMSLPNAVVVQNPVNLLDHNLVSFPQSSTLSLACVARLETFFKGQDIIFESLSSQVWKQRDWQCSLYGNGPDIEYLKSLSRYYGIENRIKLMGHINDVRSIWAENHILVLPSRGEGTPLSLVEAMLCGRPAVVTNVGGNTEWIEEGKTGFIAEAPTAKHFCTALEKAWLNRDNWQRMGLNAHKYAKNNVEQKPGKRVLDLIINSLKEEKYASFNQRNYLHI